MDKDDLYFLFGAIFAIFAFFGVDWKLLKAKLTDTAMPFPKRQLLFLALIFASLTMSAIGWYVSSHRPILQVGTETRFTEKEFRRDDPKLPYGLEVTIDTVREVEPLGVLVICDGEIGYSSARLKSGENFSQMAQGLLTNHPDVFVMKWKAPAWKPGTPLVVQLYSETPIHVKAAERVHYYWP